MKYFLTASISASAIQHNMQLLRGLLPKGTKLCPVVKDDCYGHNMQIIYPILRDLADGFCVASPKEALVLRHKGYTGFILCFLSAYGNDHEIQDELVEKGVTQTVMSTSALSAIQNAGKRLGQIAHVHLKVDTGMGRLGVPARQAYKLINAINESSHVKLTGVYTHFASADEHKSEETLNQLKLFQEILPNDPDLIIHAANSAASIDFPQTHFNMIRPGVAIYGCNPSDELNNKLDLKPCMRITARLIAVKKLSKGQRSGYGLTYEYKRDSIVGVVPVGYGAGYFRSLSNKACVSIRGQLAPIRGRVSMDQITIDLTDIPDASVGDIVEVVSSDPTAPHCVENLARLADTIPYEITCRMGHTIRHKLIC